MQINPQPLHGIWAAGFALDYHAGRGEQRTEIGEALYRLKYDLDREQMSPIVEAAVSFIRSRSESWRRWEAIIPVPPSVSSRPYRLVDELAAGIGQRLGVPVAFEYLVRRRTGSAMKDIRGMDLKTAHLRGAFRVADARFAGRHVVVFDDLYDSGATLSEIARVLRTEGQVARVFVLTITKSRTGK
jgi:predicted amidophosphoribosyltransferase